MGFMMFHLHFLRGREQRTVKSPTSHGLFQDIGVCDPHAPTPGGFCFCLVSVPRRGIFPKTCPFWIRKKKQHSAQKNGHGVEGRRWSHHAHLLHPALDKSTGYHGYRAFQDQRFTAGWIFQVPAPLHVHSVPLLHW